MQAQWSVKQVDNIAVIQTLQLWNFVHLTIEAKKFEDLVYCNIMNYPVKKLRRAKNKVQRLAFVHFMRWWITCCSAQRKSNLQGKWFFLTATQTFGGTPDIPPVNQTIARVLNFLTDLRAAHRGHMGEIIQRIRRVYWNVNLTNLSECKSDVDESIGRGKKTKMKQINIALTNKIKLCWWKSSALKSFIPMRS